jgi:hypothetical protein
MGEINGKFDELIDSRIGFVGSQARPFFYKRHPTNQQRCGLDVVARILAQNLS